MKATEGIEELQRIVTEFGDAELEMPDPLEAMWRNPVDRIEFDSERQSILLVSDRLAGVPGAPGRISRCAH